jgi:hypothetical protein
MGDTRHVAHMKDVRIAYEVLLAESAGKITL